MISNDLMIHSELCLPNERNCMKMSDLYNEGAKTSSGRNISEWGVGSVWVACLYPLLSHLPLSESISYSNSTLLSTLWLSEQCSFLFNILTRIYIKLIYCVHPQIEEVWANFQMRWKNTRFKFTKHGVLVPAYVVHKPCFI